MARVPGFEPGNSGSKVRRLTAWPHPKVDWLVERFYIIGVCYTPVLSAALELYIRYSTSHIIAWYGKTCQYVTMRSNQSTYVNILAYKAQQGALVYGLVQSLI
jgi:hypothetical protein